MTAQAVRDFLLGFDSTLIFLIYWKVSK